jgi:hypothetical protein
MRNNADIGGRGNAAYRDPWAPFKPLLRSVRDLVLQMAALARVGRGARAFRLYRCSLHLGAPAFERYPPRNADCWRCLDSHFCLRESPSTEFGPIAMGPACS